MLSCEIWEIFKNIFFYRTSPVAASDSFRDFQPAILSKKRLPQIYFSVNFAKFLKTSFDRTPPWILRSFSEHDFYRPLLGNCLFYVQVVEFQPTEKVKKYFTDAFQAFSIRTRKKPWKLSVKKLIRNEVARFQPACNFMKNTLWYILLMYFAFIFSERISIMSSKEVLKVCEHNSFQEI